VAFQSRGSTALLQGGEAILLYVIAVIVVLRFGLLSLAVGSFLFNVLDPLQITFNPSAWYFGTGMAVLLTMFALATWAFYTSAGGRTLWSGDFFD
jgi:hypothetical protein